MNTTQNYPFWNPQGAGSAQRFAEPWSITAALLAGQIQEADYLDVPQETHYSQRESNFRQEAVALVPPPQAPVHVPDPFSQTRSLLDYATQTLGSSRTSQDDNRGQAGQTDITGR